MEYILKAYLSFVLLSRPLGAFLIPHAVGLWGGVLIFHLLTAGIKNDLRVITVLSTVETCKLCSVVYRSWQRC